MLMLATIRRQVEFAVASGITDLTLYIRRGEFDRIHKFFESTLAREERLSPDAELSLFGCEIQFINDEADAHAYRAIIGQRSSTWSVAIDEGYNVVMKEKGL